MELTWKAKSFLRSGIIFEDAIIVCIFQSLVYQELEKSLDTSHSWLLEMKKLCRLLSQSLPASDITNITQSITDRETQYAEVKGEWCNLKSKNESYFYGFDYYFFY